MAPEEFFFPLLVLGSLQAIYVHSNMLLNVVSYLKNVETFNLTSKRPPMDRKGMVYIGR
jgi:hypothetical protein